MTWTQLTELIHLDLLMRGMRVVFVLAAALLLLRFVSRLLKRQGLEGSQHKVLFRLVRGLVFGLALVWILRELGFSMGPLLGAAGVLTVALGFASQTAVSNLISGLFLIVERPFHPGEVIEVDSIHGVVISVDLISTKIRAFDNQLIRLPNETVLKANVRNYTRHPIRRIDLLVGVDYSSDLKRVRELLVELVDRQPFCLDEPRPVVMFKGFGESSLDLQVSVWCARENFLELKFQLADTILKTFRQEGVEIPFPQRVLHQAGSRN